MSKIVINSIDLFKMYGSTLPDSAEQDQIIYQEESLEALTKVDIKPQIESKAIENMGQEKVDLKPDDASKAIENMGKDKIDLDVSKPGTISKELVFKNFDW